MWWISTLISFIPTPPDRSPWILRLNPSEMSAHVGAVTLSLVLLMSCSERSIWLEAQPTVAAQHSACYYPVSTANSTLHLHLSLPLSNSPICTNWHTHTHTLVHARTVRAEPALPSKCGMSRAREPEAKVQLKPFVMCHTALPKLGQLYAL